MVHEAMTRSSKNEEDMMICGEQKHQQEEEEEEVEKHPRLSIDCGDDEDLHTIVLLQPPLTSSPCYSSSSTLSLAQLQASVASAGGDDEDGASRFDCSFPLLSSSHSIEPELFSGRFKKLRRLGTGSTSNVFLACDRKTCRLMAIKEIPACTSKQRESIRNEVCALKPQRQSWSAQQQQQQALLSFCPYIVSYYGCAMLQKRGVGTIAMEYVDGGNCQDWIDAGQPAPEPWLAHISFCICSALKSLKEWGTVHKDIKPSNVLITRYGDAKLADFGLAFSLAGCRPAKEYEMKSMLGTMRYMAPERLDGRPGSLESDVWSFGLIIASMAMGEVPIKPSHSEFEQLLETDRLASQISGANNLSSSLKDFLRHCLDLDPVHRCSVEELLSLNFLDRARSWRVKCPEVLSMIQNRNPPSHVAINDAVLDGLDLDPIRDSLNCEKLAALAAELDVPSQQLLDCATLRMEQQQQQQCLPGPTSICSLTPNCRKSSAATLCSDWDCCLASLDKSVSGHTFDAFELAGQIKRSICPHTHIDMRLRVYRCCFTGSHAVELLIRSGWANSSAEAVKIGNDMLDAGAIHHIHSERLFENGQARYAFSAKVSSTPRDSAGLHVTGTQSSSKKKRRVLSGLLILRPALRQLNFLRSRFFPVSPASYSDE
jgi:serine/threonine protein kinase